MCSTLRQHNLQILFNETKLNPIEKQGRELKISEAFQPQRFGV